MTNKILIAALLFTGLQTSVTAQTTTSNATQPTPQPAARGPELALALEAAQAALAECAKREQKGGVTVVDSAGIQKVVLALDGTSPRGVTSSTAKAITSITYKARTLDLFERIKTDKDLESKIAANPAHNARPGGVLLTAANGDIIGAIGVGGARTDDECATAGLEKIKARLK